MGIYSEGVYNHIGDLGLRLLLAFIWESVLFLGLMGITWVECKGSEQAMGASCNCIP